MTAPPVPRRRRARRGAGDELRVEILRAAKDLLAQTASEDAVSIRAVAERVGVTSPSIYLHFPDKDSLLAAVCQDVFAELDARMQAAAGEAGHPFEALRRRGLAYVRFALENPEHYRLVFMRRAHPDPDHRTGTGPGDPPVGPGGPDDPLPGAAFAHLVAAVVECMQVGVFPPGDPTALAVGLWAAAHGIASLLLTQPHFPWPPVEPLIEQVIAMSGLGLAVLSRLPEGPIEAVTERLDRLR